MNQFKKAKQKALESGHSLENITDLKTAGIKEDKQVDNLKNDKKSNLAANIAEQQAITTTINPNEAAKNVEMNTALKEETTLQVDLTPVKNTMSEVVHPVKSVIPTSPAASMVIQTDEISSVHPIDVETTTIQEPSMSSQVSSAIADPVNESDNTMEQYEHSVPAQNTTKTSYIIPETPEPILVKPNTLYATIPQPALLKEYEDRPMHSDVHAPYITPKQPEHSQTAYVSKSIAQNNINWSQPDHISVMQPHTDINHSDNTTNKRSVPNIFSPKGEAKSMRKSLVLKPTSVRIAEDYCARNGGSFNELIQTLLDNFIDEYGL